MSDICLGEVVMHTNGELPSIGEHAPDFSITNLSFEPICLDDFTGQAIIINSIPSIDTSVCLDTIAELSAIADKCKRVRFINISFDLPFTLKRYVNTDKFSSIELYSDYRLRDFSKQYGIFITDGPFVGLMARSIIVLNQEHNIIHTEIMKEMNAKADIQKVDQIVSGIIQEK